MDFKQAQELAKAHTWEKYWSGQFSLFTALMIGDYAAKHMHEDVGASLIKAIYISKNHHTSCFIDLKDRKSVGEQIIQKNTPTAEDLELFCKQLKEHGKRFIEAAKQLEEAYTAEKFDLFKDAFHRYDGRHIALRHIGNHLPKSRHENEMQLLVDTRLAVEHVFETTEQIMWMIAEKLSKEVSLPANLLLCMTPYEFRTCLRTGSTPAKEELQRRFEASAYITHGHKDTLHTDLEAEQIESQLFDTKTNQVKGQSVYPGIVQGKAHIILDPKKATNFQRGDILITGMTRPDFLNLMQKAGAIITDAGGVLCHAAIVSRELRKPCVIATQIATSVFQTGDTLHVDATKGMVKKLER